MLMDKTSAAKSWKPVDPDTDQHTLRQDGLVRRCHAVQRSDFHFEGTFGSRQRTVCCVESMGNFGHIARQIVGILDRRSPKEGR